MRPRPSCRSPSAPPTPPRPSVPCSFASCRDRTYPPPHPAIRPTLRRVWGFPEEAFGARHRCPTTAFPANLIRHACLRNVELQVLPLDCEDNAGLDGPFHLLRLREGKTVGHNEVRLTNRLISDSQERRRRPARTRPR
ncbi:Scr1 family TA system antitoxin-like transcriptional regulator [Streptomyces sp. NPDC006367]|uniref:Scr1 family TA system antitoxin-like transcriptional regulator n=1 Tax=unclassified Streptomyces TaxID=2593676 RepID=UPI0033BCAD18